MPKGRSLQMVFWFTRLLWRERPLAVLANVALMFFQGLLPATQLVILQRLLDTVDRVGSGRGDVSDIIAWIVSLGGIQALSAGVQAIRAISRAYLRESAGWRLQQLVIEKAGHVPLEEFEQPAFHDRLRRATQAAAWRSFVIFENTLRVAEVAVNLASYLVLLVGAHVAVPLVLAAGALPNLISQLRRGEERYQLRRVQTAELRRAEYLVELLTNRDAAKELRLYELGKHLLEVWYRVATFLRDQRLKLTRRQQVKLGLSRITAIIGFAGAVLLLLNRTAAGVVSIGGFVALIGAATRFQNQLTQVMRQVGQVYEEALYLGDLHDFVELERDESGQAAPDTSRTYRIDFENVSFAYPGGPEVLKDLTFTIYPGEKVALVGSNGAGKTTLVKLLLGLYRPTKGRILFDGQDIRTFEPETFRKMCAAVFQDYLRYQLTARDNIGFGQAERLDDVPAITYAARAAGADQVIERLESGLDTTLGRTFEGGQDLSGGQWQKIAIARAYFRDARVLVLDEPTAALDARAELEVFEQFRALAGGRTAIFVSHRMASARIADRILVMENGRFIENGHHHELIARGGMYATMFQLQAKWYRPANGQANGREDRAEGLSSGTPEGRAGARADGRSERPAAGGEQVGHA